MSAVGLVDGLTPTTILAVGLVHQGRCLECVYRGARSGIAILRRNAQLGIDEQEQVVAARRSPEEARCRMADTPDPASFEVYRNQRALRGDFCDSLRG